MEEVELELMVALIQMSSAAIFSAYPIFQWHWLKGLQHTHHQMLGEREEE